MRQLKTKFNSAVVLITHDLGIVAEFCDTVSVIYAGQVVEHGTVEQIFAGEHNHPYTKGLIGCIPNLSKDEDRLSPIPGRMIDSRIIPQGCSFADRCPNATEKCKTVPPSIHDIDGHQILCHLYGDN